MKHILLNKKYSGTLCAIAIWAAFIQITFAGHRFLSGTPWFLFSSISRAVFGFITLFIFKKLYNKPIKEILHIKGSKKALVAGMGFLIYFVYYIITWSVGIGSITGLTAGLFFSQIILQQLTTGFFEELSCRALMLEGYFHSPQSIKNKLVYGFINFLFFGALHVFSGWSTHRFLLTGAIGFAFAVVYLKSGNVLIPMVLHFVYDIFANLQDYIVWNNSALFLNMCSILDIILIVMFVISFAILLIREKHDEHNANLS